MKIFLPYSVILFFLFNNAFAQPGAWTWLNGDSLPNTTGIFGIQGVPGALNHPPAVYEACQWTDLQGNFWLFGGSDSTGHAYGDLWKYQVSTNEWTWMKGTGISSDAGEFGIMGVPALTNWPPARGWGTATWVDLNGDLWMYGGADTAAKRNDLWRFNIASNMWTWMHGSTAPNQIAVHGTMGVPSVNNTPGGREETNGAWTDGNNNLWFFGGNHIGIDFYGDLWKYNIATNEWTWMKGANTPGQVPNYGVKGVPAAANVPGGRAPHCHWKDNNGNFWLYGGFNFAFPMVNFDRYADMWRYNPSTNMWTWMSGSKFVNDSGHYGTQCVFSALNHPRARYENRSFYTDNNGSFLFFGGFGGDIFSIESYGDLWVFNPDTLQFKYISGDTIPNQPGVYGTKGIGSLLNKPGGRGGAPGWYHASGNSLYLFGGGKAGGSFPIGNDLWKYEMDTTCVPVTTIPIVNLASSDTSFCEKLCLNFFDLSTNNPTSWQWFFPGSDSLTSILQNPTNICYNNYGSFDVTLIACNQYGCDTLILPNFINEYQNPGDSIYQSNDTLFSLPAYSYQWYEVTNGIIAGATNQYFIPQQPGSYYCVVSDSIGCIGSSGTIIITGVNQISNFQFPISIIPNPFNSTVTIAIQKQNISKLSFTIKNVLGQNVFSKEKNIGSKLEQTIDLGFLPNGIYLLEIIIDDVKSIRKIVKN